MAESALRNLFPSARDRILSQQGQMPTAPMPQETFRGRAFNTMYDMFGGNSDDPARRAQATRRAEGLVGAGRFAADFTPIVGDALAIDEAREAYRQGNMGQAAVLGGLATLGMVPVVGDAASRAVRRSAPSLGYDPAAIANAYPVTGPGALNFSNPKKPEGFMEKVLTPEERALQKARNRAQKDIEAGNYTPYFNPEDRYFANPENYDIQGNTLTDAMPARADTAAGYAARFDTPEIRERLREAYAKGLSPTSVNWYAMGQLEDEFIRILGPTEGPKQFRDRFADAMAATTGGADPTANLLMAAFVNFQKAAGNPLPKGSYNFPHPIGGRFLTGNMNMADKVIMQGGGLSAADQPKRFNFSADFMGDMSRATIDEQMSGIFEKGLKAPPGSSYGVMEGVVGSVANELGIQPGNAQDVMWAGQKGIAGMPMIEIFNQAVERTARVTGKTPEQVVEGFVRGSAPLYGIGGAAMLGGMAMQPSDSEQFQ